MNVISNEDNLKPLISAFEDLKTGELLISSGWIRSNKLNKIITNKIVNRVKKGDVKIKILLRIGELKDIEITDPGVFQFIKTLQEHPKADVQWRYSSHHHAKMFIAENEFAMVGSFNLTGGGFGDDSRPGSNPEAGIMTTNREEVINITERFYSMWESSEELNSRITGFVANKSDNNNFFMVGIGSLPAGQFVQVDSDEDGVVILGKIEKSYRYHREYYQVDENPLLDHDLLKLFSNNNVDQNLINGVATASDKYRYQLNVSEVKLLMTVKEEGSRFIFNPVNVPPAVALPVLKADAQMLKRLFNPESSSYSVLEENKDVEVSFNDKEILSKHFAVLGSTGSGKSYFVKKYIKNRLIEHTKEDDLRVIIVDTHGEYNKEETGFDFVNITADESSDISAISISGLDDIKEYFGSPSATDKKLIQRALLDEDNFLETLKDHIKNSNHDIDWDSVLEDFKIKVNSIEDIKPKDYPLLSKVDKYIKEVDELDCIEIAATKSVLINKLKDKILKEIKSNFKIEVNDNSYIEAIISGFESKSYRIKTLNLINKVEKPGIYRLDLTAVDEAHIRQNLVGDLMQEVFNKAKRNQKDGGSFKTLFIVDEAQNYAPEKSSNSISSKKWSKIIASEGRKFNVALLVMTQRPAYLSKDVLSQCSSQAIFRLINQGDINQVAGTVEGISEYDLLQLPQFTAGQALFTGVAMEMPVRVRVLA